MHRIIAWGLFPLTVCGIIGGSIVALRVGIAPGTVTFVASLTSVLTVATFERIQPYQEDWNHSKGDLLTDALYLPTFLGVNGLIEPFARGGSVVLGAALSEALGMGLWPGDWSILAQLALACVVVEAFDYWPHRMLHELPWLWRFHAIHHNPKRVYWLNATRAHPMEIAFRGIVNVIPLALLGAGADVIALIAVTNAVLGMYQHANIDFELGPLTWIFSVGEMHRWHHSIRLEEANSNYGSNFLFWDVVFGTRYRDATRRGPDEIGVAHDELPAAWWRQMGAPFRGA
jgi:sterol desaturase/sphingolipid hydroxylase (fatty acid hydroxylase superfamily)